MLAAVVAAAFPEEPFTSPPRESRIRTWIRHPERSAVLLALLIGFASVFSAVLAWRASVASIDASRYESLAVQQQARRQQIERELEGTVGQDLRFVAQFQEHALAARELQAQADEVRGTDPDAADVLDLEAQSRRAMARAMKPFFMGASGIEIDENGTVPYDVAFVLRNLTEGNVEWRELRTTVPHTIALAQRADEKSLNIVGVAAIIVAALFFLTIAQVSRTRYRMRQVFFVAGGVMVALGTFAFLVVEVFG